MPILRIDCCMYNNVIDFDNLDVVWWDEIVLDKWRNED